MPANPNNWMAFFLNNSAENNRSKVKSALIQSNKSLKTQTHLSHNPAKTSWILLLQNLSRNPSKVKRALIRINITVKNLTHLSHNPESFYFTICSEETIQWTKPKYFYICFYELELFLSNLPLLNSHAFHRMFSLPSGTLWNNPPWVLQPRHS